VFGVPDVCQAPSFPALGWNFKLIERDCHQLGAHPKTPPPVEMTACVILPLSSVSKSSIVPILSPLLL
jgi:hypothetical protein